MAEPKVRVLRLIKEPSFPSGHVMFYMSAFGFLKAAALATLWPSALRRAIVAVGSALIGLVGASRIYLGAHWPSDVSVWRSLPRRGARTLYARQTPPCAPFATSTHI